jgi:hypothetical protein
MKRILLPAENAVGNSRVDKEWFFYCENYTQYKYNERENANVFFSKLVVQILATRTQGHNSGADIIDGKIRNYTESKKNMKKTLRVLNEKLTVEAAERVTYETVWHIPHLGLRRNDVYCLHQERKTCVMLTLSGRSRSFSKQSVNAVQNININVYKILSCNRLTNC